MNNSSNGNGKPPPRPQSRAPDKIRVRKCEGCDVKFLPTSPRQLYHDTKCRDKEAHRRQRLIAKQQQLQGR